jgi:hypothetical protein
MMETFSSVAYESEDVVHTVDHGHKFIVHLSWLNGFDGSSLYDYSSLGISKKTFDNP